MERKPEVIHIVGNNLRFSLGFYIFLGNTVCGQPIWAKLLLWDALEKGISCGNIKILK